jgi:hypothetical protein
MFGVETFDDESPLQQGVPEMAWWLDSMRLMRLRTKDALSSTAGAGLVEGATGALAAAA